MKLPIYFISDVHLQLCPDGEGKSREEKLIRFLKHISNKGGTLYIVGDFFDFYFEYKYVIPKMYFAVYQQLNHLKSTGVDIHFITGNHDHWGLDFLQNVLTTSVYLDDTVVESNGKRFYITHGDGILSWDWGYRVLKSIIRNRLFTWFYRWLHPTIGYGIARWIADRSHHYTYTDEYKEKILKEMRVFTETIAADGFDYVITGHYHQAVVEKIHGGTMVILGDWLQHFSYAVFNGKDIELKYWKEDA